jgi:hypothetical protein
LRKESERVRIVARMMEQFPGITPAQAEKLYSSSKAGGELRKFATADEWFSERFAPNVVILNRDDYVLALTHALRHAPKLAATDFGSTRQRDLGQVWTDAARGYLGEIAFARLMEKRFGIRMELDYSVGAVNDYLISDIKSVRLADGTQVAIPQTISIKTTKFNGIWLDIPGAQAGHSTTFFLIKIGIEREHFVSFLKDISFVAGKLLPEAVRIGAITQDSADELWQSLPTFRDIPCYVCGFIDGESVRAYQDVAPVYRELRDKFKQPKDRYEVAEYIGWVRKGVPDNLPESLVGKSEFLSIGAFTPSNDHFISSVGFLKNAAPEWERFLTAATGSAVRVEKAGNDEKAVAG